MPVWSPKGLGPVKLGDSSFSAGLQIKQSCRAKQNPLQSYFPPSVWPDKIQGNHFNPEAFPDQETLDQSDLTKRPNQHTVKALPKVVHFLCGGNRKASSNLASFPAGELSAPRPVWATFLNWKHLPFNRFLLFLPAIWVRHPYWQHPEFPHWFKIFQVTCQIFSFTLALCSPVAKRSQSLPAALRLACCLF